METEQFISEINQFLNRVKMNKTDLAKHLDYPYSTISRWFNFHLPPRPSAINHVRLFMKTYKPGRIKAKGTK